MQPLLAPSTSLRPTPGRGAARVLAHGLALAVGLGLALGVLVAQPAAAHDRLVSSDPADGATLAEAPTSITLVFSGEVLAEGAQVVVETPAGTTSADVGVDGVRAVATLPAGLSAGEWDVTWRVVSADGHPVEGGLALTVEGAEEAAAPSPTPTEAATATASPGARGHGAHEHGDPGVGLDADGEAGWAAVWLFPVAVLAAVGVAAAVVLRARRRDEDLTGGDGSGDDGGAVPGDRPEDRPDPGRTPGP